MYGRPGRMRFRTGSAHLRNSHIPRIGQFTGGAEDSGIMSRKKTFLFSVLFVFALVVFILTSGRNNERAGRLVVDVKGYIKYQNVTRTVNTRNSSHFVYIENVTKTIETMKTNTSNSSQFVHIEEKLTTTVKPTTSSSFDFVKVLNLGNNTLSTRQGKCADIVCSNFLATSKNHCATKSIPAWIKSGTRITPKCHFQNGTMKHRVLLRSFPGSGNTWTRQLLEKSSGICTGN